MDQEQEQAVSSPPPLPEEPQIEATITRPPGGTTVTLTNYTPLSNSNSERPVFARFAGAYLRIIYPPEPDANGVIHADWCKWCGGPPYYTKKADLDEHMKMHVITRGPQPVRRSVASQTTSDVGSQTIEPWPPDGWEWQEEGDLEVPDTVAAGEADPPGPEPAPVVTDPDANSGSDESEEDDSGEDGSEEDGSEEDESEEYESEEYESEVDETGSNSEPEDPELVELEDQELVEAEDSELVEAEDPELMELEDHELVEPEDPELVEPEDTELVEPENPELLEAEDPELVDVEPEDPELVEPEDPELLEAEDPELVEPEDPEVVEPEDHELVEPEDHELVEPEDHELVESEDLELVEPEDPEVEEPENLELVEPENLELVEPEDPELVEMETQAKAAGAGANDSDEEFQLSPNLSPSLFVNQFEDLEDSQSDESVDSDGEARDKQYSKLKFLVNLSRLQFKEMGISNLPVPVLPATAPIVSLDPDQPSTSAHALAQAQGGVGKIAKITKVTEEEEKEDVEIIDLEEQEAEDGDDPMIHGDSESEAQEVGEPTRITPKNHGDGGDSEESMEMEVGAEIEIQTELLVLPPPPSSTSSTNSSIPLDPSEFLVSTDTIEETVLKVQEIQLGSSPGPEQLPEPASAPGPSESPEASGSEMSRNWNPGTSTRQGKGSEFGQSTRAKAAAAATASGTSHSEAKSIPAALVPEPKMKLRSRPSKKLIPRKKIVQPKKSKLVRTEDPVPASSAATTVEPSTPSPPALPVSVPPLVLFLEASTPTPDPDPEPSDAAATPALISVPSIQTTDPAPFLDSLAPAASPSLAQEPVAGPSRERPTLPKKSNPTRTLKKKIKKPPPKPKSSGPLVTNCRFCFGLLPTPLNNSVTAERRIYPESCPQCFPKFPGIYMRVVPRFRKKVYKCSKCSHEGDARKPVMDHCVRHSDPNFTPRAGAADCYIIFENIKPKVPGEVPPSSSKVKVEKVEPEEEIEEPADPDENHEILDSPTTAAATAPAGADEAYEDLPEAEPQPSTSSSARRSGRRAGLGSSPGPPPPHPIRTCPHPQCGRTFQSIAEYEAHMRAHAMGKWWNKNK